MVAAMTGTTDGPKPQYGAPEDHISELVKILPDSIISHRKADLAAYHDIGLDFSPMGLIVRPRTYTDVSTLLAHCNRHGLAVTPWGGGTNLCGALTPDRPAIALDMKSLNGILSVETADRTITVQAGATFKAIHDTLDPLGLRFPHDPWSWRSSTVGGAVALDSAGNLYPRFGSIRDQVLMLKVALADGRILDVGTSLSKTSSHPFLPSLFIGSEGTLGVILEATLAIFPSPETYATTGFAFSSFEDMFAAVTGLRDRGLEADSYIGGTVPPRVERLQPMAERMLVKMLSIQSALFLYYEGPEKDVEARVREAHTVLKRRGTRMPSSYPDEWWGKRHTYFEMSPELASGGIYVHVFDLCVPESKVLSLSREVAGIARDHALGDVLSHTLFGAPDAYTIALYVDDSPEGRTTIGTFQHDLIPQVHDHGGTLTRTHGLGTHFPENVAAREIGEGNLLLLRGLKGLLDPSGILNPGIMFGRE